MKKIFIILLLFMTFIFIFNNSKASASYFADTYGTNMTYKTLMLNDDFEFTGDWWNNGTDTYIFEYRPVEKSLEDFIRFLPNTIMEFMKIYTPTDTLQYLLNTNSIPTDDDMGWTNDDGYIYIIITQDYFQEYYPGQPVLPVMGDIADTIRVDTWVITETTPDYQMGYNTGYQHGYTSGYNNGYDNGYDEGWDAKEAEINALLPGIRQAEYQRGYDDGYDDGVIAGETVAYEKGYIDGANESFIASIDKWIVPAIIIVMILGGYFAIARKKREGDI